MIKYSEHKGYYQALITDKSLVDIINKSHKTNHESVKIQGKAKNMKQFKDNTSLIIQQIVINN